MNAASIAAHLVCIAIIVTFTKVVILPALAEAHNNGVERLRKAGYGNGTSLLVLRERRRQHRKRAAIRALRAKKGQS